MRANRNLPVSEADGEVLEHPLPICLELRRNRLRAGHQPSGQSARSNAIPIGDFDGDDRRIVTGRALVQAAAVGAPRSVRRDPDLLVDHVLHCCLPDGAGARREEDVVLLAARFDET